MTVKERLIEFIKFKGLSIRKFETTCGLSYGYVNNMRVSIQPSKIKNIAQQFPDLNTGWLLTGEGEMLKGKPANQGHKEDCDCEECREKDNEIRQLNKQILELQQKLIQCYEKLQQPPEDLGQKRKAV